MQGQRVSRRSLVFGLAWLLSLAAAGASGAAWAQRPPEPSQVLSGPDIGFHVQSVGKGGVRVGALVVRVDGNWVETEFAAAPRRVR